MRRKWVKTEFPGVYMDPMRPGDRRIRGECENAKGVHHEFDQILPYPAPATPSVHLARRLSVEASIEREKKLNQLRGRSEDGKVVRLRVGEFAASWLKLHGPHLLAKSLADYGAALDDHILPEIGEIYCDAITSDDVQIAVNNWIAKPAPGGKDARYAANSVRFWFKVTKAMLTAAVDRNLIPRDPCRKIETPANVRPRGEKRVLTDLEQYAADAWYRQHEPDHHAIYAVMLRTGMRFAHTVPLRFADIDETARPGAPFGVILPKFSRPRNEMQAIAANKKVPEVLPMTQEIRDILRAQRVRLVELQHPALEDGWCFPQKDENAPLRHDLFQDSFRVCMEAVGAELAPGCGPHTLRRTFVTMATLEGIDPSVGKDAIGHSSEVQYLGYASDHALSLLSNQKMARAFDRVSKRISATDADAKKKKR